MSLAWPKKTMIALQVAFVIGFYFVTCQLVFVAHSTPQGSSHIDFFNVVFLLEVLEQFLSSLSILENLESLWITFIRLNKFVKSEHSLTLLSSSLEIITVVKHEQVRVILIATKQHIS